VELEIRQDLIADEDGQREWAEILATVLVEGLAGLGIREHRNTVDCTFQ